MKFEEKLMTLRKEKGWSQEELSNKIGVSRQTISKWESAQTTPELNKLRELSKIFEISIDELVKENEEKEEGKEKVLVKANLKKLYILMIVIGILTIFTIIFSVLYIRNKEENYIEDVVVATYNYKLQDTVSVIEVYIFDENKKCIGVNAHCEVKNNADLEYIVDDLNKKGKLIDNLIVKDNSISFISKKYIECKKEDILNKVKENSNYVENLKVVDM